MTETVKRLSPRQNVTCLIQTAVSNQEEPEDGKVRNKGLSAEEVLQEKKYPDMLLDFTTSFHSVRAQQLFIEHSYVLPQPVESNEIGIKSVSNPSYRPEESLEPIRIPDEDEQPIVISEEDEEVSVIFQVEENLEEDHTDRESPMEQESTETHRIDLKTLNVNSETHSTSRKYIFKLKLIQKSYTAPPELEDLKIAWGGITTDESRKFLGTITFKSYTEPKSNNSFQVVETNLVKNLQQMAQPVEGLFWIKVSVVGHMSPRSAENSVKQLLKRTIADAFLQATNKVVAQKQPNVEEGERFLKVLESPCISCNENIQKETDSTKKS